WVGAEPLITQMTPAGVVGVPTKDQLTPKPPGSGSLTVTPVAAPGPALDRVMTKPTVAPRLTGLASAVLDNVRFGQLTVIVSEAVSGLTAMFVPVTVTVFGRVPVVQAVADEVPLVTW